MINSIGRALISVDMQERDCDHIADKDNNVPTNDGWVPVEKELPPFGQRLQATILHHEWIADYNSSWVPDEEKSYHPEYTEVCEIYPIEGMWFYACGEDDYEKDVAYINPKKDLGNPISEIIAWRPMPEPYRPEGNVSITENEAINKPTKPQLQVERSIAEEECRKAMEKQKPRKPLGGVDIAGNEYMICPYCSAIVEDGEWRANYCPDCGQAIEWNENLEGMR